MTGSLMKSAPAGAIVAVSMEDAAALVEQEMEGVATGSGGVTYVNFSGKLGKYAVGKEKEDIDPDDLFVLDLRYLLKGWNCWKGSKPVEKHRWSMLDRASAVAEEDLQDHGPYRANLGEGWRQMVGFWTRSLTTGDDTVYEFTTDSVSGRNSVDDVVKEMVDRAKKREPAFPVISFDKKQFTAQETTNWKPVFPVHAWATEEQVQAVLQDTGYTVDDLLAGKPVSAAQRKKLAA